MNKRKFSIQINKNGIFFLGILHKLLPKNYLTDALRVSKYKYSIYLLKELLLAEKTQKYLWFK